ncbi:hypothetical protein JCM8097_002853 [Rhodosporidiobolus ruineniae]
MPVICIATLRALPGQENTLAQLLSDIRDHAQREEGCLRYEVGRKGSEFVCAEVYRDSKAVEQHAEENEGVKALVAALQAGGVVDGSPSIVGPFEQY